MAKSVLSRSVILGLSVISMGSAWAAKPVNLANQPLSFLQSISMMPQFEMKQISSHVDFNQTTHVRLKETYKGYNVWGGDAVAHIPMANPDTHLNNLSQQQLKAGSMNGVIYQDLAADLNSAPAYIFNAAQADKAMQHVINLYQQAKGIKANLIDSKKELMVFVDKNNKAHWAFLISLYTHTAKALPEKPTYIIDAVNFEVLKQWNNLQTSSVQGGGFGGNIKMGKLVYDGAANDYASLKMKRSGNQCSLENKDVVVRDRRNNDATMSFSCAATDSTHNDVYWNADYDAVNGGYSPSNDALYAGKVIKEMYKKWYKIPVLEQGGKPMLLVMRVHEDMDNAYWDGSSMTFGDGVSMFYPLTSLGVGAHEVSHGFTEQHSGLVYSGQSGGLNESFSDMAAQAAEYYSVGKNSWQIGPEIFKEDGKALRYMDEPTKDCEGRAPGNWCSIDNMKDYNDYLDVHYTSGIFNKAFYLMGSANKWTPRKAFNVMVKANTDYWTASTSFQDAACGVMKATKDYGYGPKPVIAAFKGVGIDVSKC